MDLTTVLAGCGAILTAAGGLILVVREFRRRDRKAANAELADLSADLHRCRRLHVDWRRYAFELRERMADHGVDVPEAPADQ